MDQKKTTSDFVGIEQLAMTHQLGELRLSFKNPASLIRRSFTKSIIRVLLIPPGLLIWMVVAEVVMLLLMYKSAFWSAVIIFLIGMSIYIILLCYGVISFKYALDELKNRKHLKKEQVHRFEYGFITWDKKKDVLSAIRWEQIKALDTYGKQKGTQWLTGLTIITKITEDKAWAEFFGCVAKNLRKKVEARGPLKRS